MVNIFKEKVSIEEASWPTFPVLYYMYSVYIDELGCYTKHAVKLSAKEFEKTWMEPILRTAYIIKYNGRIAGFALIETVRRSLCDIEKDSIYIAEFYVIPEYRNKEVGSSAVSLLLREYPEEPFFLAVLKKNSIAQEFWNKQIKNNKVKIEKRKDLHFPHQRELNVMCFQN